jgi:hypothetical protein
LCTQCIKPTHTLIEKIDNIIDAKIELFIPLQLLLIYNENLKLKKDKLF